MKCPKCGLENPIGTDSCVSCGSYLGLLVPKQQSPDTTNEKPLAQMDLSDYAKREEINRLEKSLFDRLNALMVRTDKVEKNLEDALAKLAELNVEKMGIIETIVIQLEQRMKALEKPRAKIKKKIKKPKKVKSKKKRKKARR